MAAGYLRYPHIHGDLLTFTAGDDVWLAPAAGGRAWRLTADDVPVSYPRFSRDGSQLAWTSWRDGNPEVYAADTEGSTANRLTYWGDPQTRVTGWTAAGEVLAVTAANQPAQKYRRAYAVPGDGATPPRLLPFGAGQRRGHRGRGHRPAHRERGPRARVLEAVPRRPGRQTVDRHRPRIPCSPGCSATWMASWPARC